LVVLTTLVFFRVHTHSFVNWDDPEYVTDNPHVAQGVTFPAVRWAFTESYAANWHPVTWLSHMLDVQLFGMNPGPQHLVSLGLHLAATVLLFWWLYSVTCRLMAAAVVAALFAIHPSHVESVAWIAERKDVLSGLFWMATLWAYTLYVRSPRIATYALVCVAFALGLMAKPMLITLPFVLLLLDVWPFGRLRVGTRNVAAAWPFVREKLPLFALSFASALITIIAQSRGGAVARLDAYPLTVRVANAVVSYVAYIVQLVWPANLAVVYPYRGAPPMWTVAGSFAVLCIVSVAAVRSRARHPYLLVGWLWYVVTLLPVIGLVQVGSQAMADRYTYLPGIGLFIAIVWGIQALIERRPRLGVVATPAAVLAVALYALAAHAQVRHWQNDLTLWGHAIDVTAENARAHNNLANALVASGDTGEAIAHYREAVRIRPTFAEAHGNLANTLATQGRVADAIAEYREALRLNPRDPFALNGLGAALDDAGRTSEAIEQYLEAIRVDPTFASAYNNLGVAYANQGRSRDAIGALSAAVRIRPLAADYQFNLAMLFEQAGLRDSARVHAALAVRANPAHASARALLQRLGGLP
jgi:Flp pilus assembly protein TadD